jgi:hypothetical protein
MNTAEQTEAILHPARDLQLICWALVMLLADSAVVNGLFQFLIPTHMALFAHAIIGLIPIAAAGMSAADPSRTGWLVLMGILTLAFGPLGLIGFYLSIGFRGFASSDAQGFLMLQMLLPTQKESLGQRLVEEIRYNPELTASESDVTPFNERIRLGTSEQKRGVLAHINHHYIPEFSALVRECLQDKDPLVRVQAATVMSKIAKKHQCQVSESLEKYEENPCDETILQLAAAYEEFCFSGVVDRFTEQEIRQKAIEYYGIFVEKHPRQREVKRVYGRLLYRDKQWQQAYDLFYTLYNGEGRSFPNEMTWLIECAYKLGKFETVRELATELLRTPESEELPLEIKEILNLWVPEKSESKL